VEEIKRWVEKNDVLNVEAKKSRSLETQKNVKSANIPGQENPEEKHQRKRKSDFR
jgi:hypothetical protein